MENPRCRAGASADSDRASWRAASLVSSSSASILPKDPFRRLLDESVTWLMPTFELAHEARALNVRAIRERGGAYRRRDQ